MFFEKNQRVSLANEWQVKENVINQLPFHRADIASIHWTRLAALVGGRTTGIGAEINRGTAWQQHVCQCGTAIIAEGRELDVDVTPRAKTTVVVTGEIETTADKSATVSAGIVCDNRVRERCRATIDVDASITGGGISVDRDIR